MNSTSTIDTIRELLHVVSGVLVWPVLIALLLLAALTLVALGAFIQECWSTTLYQSYILIVVSVVGKI